MQSNAQRYTGCCARIRERDRPRQMRRFTPAATRGKAAQTSNAMSDGQARREQIGRSQYGQPLLAHVKPRKDQRRDKSAKE